MTFHHANTRGSRAERLKMAGLLCLKTFCHPRVMSHSLPHLTLTTSTSSLSPTSPILRSFSFTLSSLLSHDPASCTLRRFRAEWRILGNPISPQNKETWDNLLATRDNRNKSFDMSRGTNMKHLRTPETAVQAPIQRLPSRRSKNRLSRSQSMLCAIR